MRDVISVERAGLEREDRLEQCFERTQVTPFPSFIATAAIILF